MTFKILYKFSPKKSKILEFSAKTRKNPPQTSKNPFQGKSSQNFKRIPPKILMKYLPKFQAVTKF